MAGRGQRFVDAGYKVPKQLIYVKEKQLIDLSLESVDSSECNLIFVVRDDQICNFHIDDILMNELQDVIKISNSDETIYIADGMTGQDAVNSSKLFSERIDISGVILTKMDGDSKGGAALSIKEVIKKPIILL